ncbi:MAG: DUF47 family protein [Endozoicomonas sp.]
MDLTTLASLFSGSPFKPLGLHREAVLDALLCLNRQILNLNAERHTSQGAQQWLCEQPARLEKLEQDVLARLQQPTLTAQPKDLIISMMQTQSSLAHQIFRLAERLSYRPLKLPLEISDSMQSLGKQFSKTVYHLRKGVAELDELNQAGFRKQHGRKLQDIRHQLASYTDELRNTSHDIRNQACELESHMDAVDVALLFLILDDISDLSLWMRSMMVHLQTW